MLLVRVGSTQFISIFFDKKLCMKTWYNLKIFMNFADFSCVTFLAQNVPIPLYHILLLSMKPDVPLNL